jgi:hypothetical protein
VALNLSLGHGPLAPRAGGLRIRRHVRSGFFINIMLVRHFDSGGFGFARAGIAVRRFSKM